MIKPNPSEMKYQIDSGENVLHAVIEAVSDYENRSPMSLPPLNETLDPDILSGLFDSQYDDGKCLLFSYSDSYIAIQDGCISIHRKSTDEEWSTRCPHCSDKL
jgi:hypothetical protein